jgi:hypothetical protein
MAIGDPAQPVIFTGENPCLSLYRAGTDQLVATASYWLASSSSQGEGSALMIWADPEASGLGELAPHAIYADNAALARMLNADLNQHFGPFQGRGFAELEPQPARFSQQADGRRQHRIVCWTATTTIELIWSDALEAFQKMNVSTLGGREFRVGNVIAACAGGNISVNGTKATGEVRRQEGLTATSAFLAFAESWVPL